MADLEVFGELKSVLRNEVTRFCGANSAAWRLPARKALWRLHETGWQAVLFGGTLRSLLWSRLYCKRPGRPRDIDIVVRDVELDALRNSFVHVLRETRFGGLKAREDNWLFDVWPLDRTWMFLHDKVKKPSFEQLPNTTAFNIEAIAVEIWPEKGHSRMIFSGDDQFFQGIAGRIIELNRTENPFPELTVIRALLLAQNLSFDLGSRLASYVVEHGSRVSFCDLERIQLMHYGAVREEAQVLVQSINDIKRQLDKGNSDRFRIPSVKQLSLFEENADNPYRVRAFALDP